MSSSLTGCSSWKTFSFAFSTNYEISKNNKKNDKQNLSSTNAFRTKLVVVSSIKNQRIKNIRFFRSRAKTGWQMQEIFTWKQFILVFLVLKRKLNFCVITEIMVTGTKKIRRTNNQRTRPWRSRQRVSLII